MFADVARRFERVESIFDESMPDVARRSDAWVRESCLFCSAAIELN
jgi:hypothetical protein